MAPYSSLAATLRVPPALFSSLDQNAEARDSRKALRLGQTRTHRRRKLRPRRSPRLSERSVARFGKRVRSPTRIRIRATSSAMPETTPFSFLSSRAVLRRSRGRARDLHCAPQILSTILKFCFWVAQRFTAPLYPLLIAGFTAPDVSLLNDFR